MILMVTPVAVDTIGYQYYFVYAILGACIPVCVFLFYPETNGRSVEQIDELFREHATIAAIVKASLKPPISQTEQLEIIREKEAHGSDSTQIESKLDA